MEYYIRKGRTHVHNTAIFSEMALLILMGMGGARFARTDGHKEILACMLLLTMGLQNSLVTTVSSANVRTTHLTGLFTDMALNYRNCSFIRNKASRIN